jgi:hypothetical protein
VYYRDGVATGCGLWFVRLFILPHTIVGIGFLCLAIGSTGLYVAVGLFGDTYQGKITKKEIRKSKSGKSHYAHFAFTANDREYTGEVSISEVRFGEINEGDAITVRALESWPGQGNWPRVPGHWPLLDVGVMWLVAVFWNGILSIFLWGAYVRPMRIKWLLRYGQPTQGIVRAVQERRGKGATTYQIAYDYVAPSPDGGEGQLFNKKMSSSRKESAHAGAGDLVTVLYNPRKPWRSVIYRYSEYRVK